MIKRKPPLCSPFQTACVAAVCCVCGLMFELKEKSILHFADGLGGNFDFAQGSGFVAFLFAFGHAV